ncbi:MAG: class II aldolase/adducin family protein [Achromobacter sp.]|jgi:ribulose-5-phosphate 4-epimerase/fuculose-1-phosphate aldolase
MTSAALAAPPIDVSPAEWHTRCELAALYRVIAHFRMTDMIDTHITARVADEPDRFLINRYGVLFKDMRASDLIKIDHDGKRCDDAVAASDRDVNAAGFTIHSAIHHARPDLHYVIHTHTAAGIGVAAQEDGLLPISQHALKFYGCLSYHDYEGIALDLGERERLVRDLGSNRAMILRNHGLLVGGPTAAEAFHEIYFLEAACKAQIQAQAGGAKLRVPSEAVCRKTAAQYVDDAADAINRLAWAAALRLIDEDYRA